MANDPLISVTVCYAPTHRQEVHRQEVVSMMLPSRTTVLHAIQESGILDRYPAVDLSENKVGIFGEVVGLERVLRNRDRVEIYRPLPCSPMEARRRRAAREK